VATGLRARNLHTSSTVAARVLAADPIESVCADILRKRNHELVALDKTPKPDELVGMIGEYDGLIVRRCVLNSAASKRTHAPTPHGGARPRPTTTRTHSRSAQLRSHTCVLITSARAASLSPLRPYPTRPAAQWVPGDQGGDSGWEEPEGDWARRRGRR
jgi:hypothetical protein